MNTLMDAAIDLFGLLVLLEEGYRAKDAILFRDAVCAALDTLEQQGRAAGIRAEHLDEARYALCACLDEAVLRSNDEALNTLFHEGSLQYRYFKTHLAGEGFFERLQVLQADPTHNLNVLELYHQCLLLGFEGQYAGQPDVLRHKTQTLGQLLAQCNPPGESVPPSWAIPDPVTGPARPPFALWGWWALGTLACLALYVGLDAALQQQIMALSSTLDQLFIDPAPQQAAP